MVDCGEVTKKPIGRENEDCSDSGTELALLTENNNLKGVAGKSETKDQHLDTHVTFRHDSIHSHSCTSDTKLTKLPKFHQCLGSVESCPQLKSVLPSGYNYIICSLHPFETYDGEERFSAVFRIALVTADEAEQWLYEFQSSSKTTWRVDKTYPDPQTKVVFKKDYHCQHNTRSTSHKERKIQNSHKKNTNCPAKLTITVKKFAKRTKSEDPHAKTHATMVSLKQTHNHKVMIGEALRHRPVSDDVRAKFMEMYRIGLTPPQALAKHQMELKEQHGDSYNEVIVDRFLCPDIHWCYRLYYKVYKPKNSAIEVEEDEVTMEARASDVEAMLRQWTEGLCRKLRQKPKVFVPVVEKLLTMSQSLLDDSHLSRVSTNCLTDNDKSYTGMTQCGNILRMSKELTVNHHSSQISQRKSLSQKRSRSSKLTHTKEHDYSSLRPVMNDDFGTDSNSFAQSIVIPASYGSGLVLSGDVTLNSIPETWGIMFGPQCDLAAQVLQYENLNHSEPEVTTLVTPQDVNDQVKETLMDVPMHYDVDHTAAQTFHFISDDNTHINVVRVNSNQSADVSNVADLKELFKCF